MRCRSNWSRIESGAVSRNGAHGYRPVVATPTSQIVAIDAWEATLNVAGRSLVPPSGGPA